MTSATAIAVVILATVVAVFFVRSFIARPPEHDSPDDFAESWLVAARRSVETGRAVARRLDEVQRDRETPLELIVEIDALAGRLTDLSANAPTAMDSRVCRNLAVCSRVLSDYLAAAREDDGSPRSTSRDPSARDRRMDFTTAVRDLADHVTLL